LVLVALTFLSVFSACRSLPQPGPPVKTVVLVRHAEKVDESKDAALSEAGLVRVERLQKMLSSISFDAAYTTPYQRTRNTISRIAEDHRLNVQEYSPDTLWQFSQRIIKTPETRIIISGHSNTTPALINHWLGRDVYPPIEHSDYSRIYLVTLQGEKVLSHVVLHY
jgi:2,3-bisphosphoglycerate-dependent phosphoglycerate mutase